MEGAEQAAGRRTEPPPPREGAEASSVLKAESEEALPRTKQWQDSVGLRTQRVSSHLPAPPSSNSATLGRAGGPLETRSPHSGYAARVFREQTV